ncbi:MAG: hypothetical protein NVSMB56_08630 [Pyrinomonadaceae bacterium]
MTKNDATTKEMLKTPNTDTALEVHSNRNRVKLAGIIFAVAMGSVAYRLLVWKHLEQTSALFIGIPTLLALAAVFLPNAKSATGMIMKVLTLALLISGILLGEGFICIVMAAPLFYLVGLFFGLCYDYLKRRNESNANRNFSLLMLPFLLMSIEGTHDKLSFTRNESVIVERMVTANGAQVEQILNQTPRFEKSLPVYLRLGFPQPVATSGAGLHVGDRRTIKFAGGEGKPGELILEIVEVNSNAVRFRAVSDTSHIAHWLDWKEAEVSWTPIDEKHTKVNWTLRYERHLDPAWYFAFWERYGVSCAANYLIDTFQ